MMGIDVHMAMDDVMDILFFVLMAGRSNVRRTVAARDLFAQACEHTGTSSYGEAD